MGFRILLMKNTIMKKNLSVLFTLISIFVVGVLATNVYAQNPLGTVNPPPGPNQFLNGNVGGLSLLIANLIKTAIALAGLYAVVNFVLAGYSFMSAGGDPKKIEDAWAKIYQTIIGLVFTAGAFVLAAMVSRLLFGSYGYLFQLKVFGP